MKRTRQSDSMPIPREISEELQRRRFAEHREAERDKRWDYVRTALHCWGWCLLGLVLIGWSFHTTDDRFARIAFLAGLGVGNTGIIFSILALYRRGESRGDW
jgi:hypothetical protein